MIMNKFFYLSLYLFDFILVFMLDRNWWLISYLFTSIQGPSLSELIGIINTVGSDEGVSAQWANITQINDPIHPLHGPLYWNQLYAQNSPLKSMKSRESSNIRSYGVLMGMGFLWLQFFLETFQVELAVLCTLVIHLSVCSW